MVFVFSCIAILLIVVVGSIGWHKHRPLVAGYVAAVLPISAAIVILGLSLTVPDAGRCDSQESQAKTPYTFAGAADGSTLLSKEVKIVDPRDTQIALGSDPGPARAAISLNTGTLTAAPNTTDVGVSRDSFRRGDNPVVLDAVHAHAGFTASQRVTVWLCIERGGETDGFRLDPGTYTGAVTLTDDRLPNTTIPFTFTLSYSNEYRPLLLWCGIVLVGAAYLSVIRRPIDPDPTSSPLGVVSLLTYLSEPLGLAATIAGGAAALGVYAASCLTSDTWGASSADWFGLTATMFGSFVAAGTAFRFANALDNRTPESTGKQVAPKRADNRASGSESGKAGQE